MMLCVAEVELIVSIAVAPNSEAAVAIACVTLSSLGDNGMYNCLLYGRGGVCEAAILFMISILVPHS